MPGRVWPYLVLAVVLAAACGQEAGLGDALPVPTPAGPSAGTAPGSRVLGNGAPPSERAAGSANLAGLTTGEAGSAPPPAPPGGHRPAAGGAEPRGWATSAPGSRSAPGVIFGAPRTASTGPSSAAETVPDRTGVGDRELVVGVHAPISGAPRFPRSSGPTSSSTGAGWPTGAAYSGARSASSSRTISSIPAAPFRSAGSSSRSTGSSSSSGSAPTRWPPAPATPTASGCPTSPRVAPRTLWPGCPAFSPCR